MNYTPEEVAALLAERPHQPHYIAAMIRKCINAGEAHVSMEREARVAREIAGAINILWEQIDADREPKEGLTTVATRAANALHWRTKDRDHHKQRAEEMAAALADARDYVTTELARERANFAGHENCSDIPTIEADLARIDALLAPPIGPDTLG